jgi:hypothetical protein
MKTTQNDVPLPANTGGLGAGVEPAARPDLEDPRVVLAVLETDQVVAAKQRTRFGRRTLSPRTRIMLWGLRIYVVAMLVLVVISVIRAMHGSH